MKQFLKYKQLVVGSTIVLTIFAGTLAAAPSANAIIPGPGPSSPGTTCTLPDGRIGAVESDGHTCCPVGSSSGNNSCLFDKYVNPVIDLLSAVVGVVAVIAIIIGAIEFSSSAGDPQRAASGRKHIVNALIGLLAYLLLFTFLQFVLPGGLLNG